MRNISQLELWFVAGSQNLYGNKVLAKVEEHSERIATCPVVGM